MAALDPDPSPALSGDLLGPGVAHDLPGAFTHTREKAMSGHGENLYAAIVMIGAISVIWIGFARVLIGWTFG